MQHSRVATAFVIVVVVATAVATWANKDSIDGLQHARDESCQNYTVLKDAVNHFHYTVSGFLKAARTAREKSASTETDPIKKKADLDAVKAYTVLLQNTHTVKARCAQHQ